MIKEQSHGLILTLLLVINLFSVTQFASTSHLTLIPDQFIGEVFPNCTVPLQLSHTSTRIKFNFTRFPKEIDIQFDANYTIFNPESNTIIPLILPFSFPINLTKFIFTVNTNSTQISYDLFTLATWNEDYIKIDVPFRSIHTYPITFIRSNVTLFKNSRFVIRYYFRGLLINPADSNDGIYIGYYLGTSQDWIGNTSGGIELTIYGKHPRFNSGGLSEFATRQLIDIDGGQSLILIWNNIKIPGTDVGIQYYRELTPFEKFIDFMALNNSITWAIFIILAIFIVWIIFIIKNRKKREVI